MALKFQPSFTTGELDPALQERTTLEKFKAGLKTARGVIVGKSGRLVSRAGRKHLIKTKLDDRRVVVFPMSAVGIFVEWGHQYVRMYNSDAGTLLHDTAHAFTEDDLDELQFVMINSTTVMVLKENSTSLLLRTNGFDTGFFGPPVAPTVISNSAGGTLYDVDYAITLVIGGEESVLVETATGKKPAGFADKNAIVAQGANLWASRFSVSEFRFYRRPRSAGVYGFIGSTSKFTQSGANLRATFDDIGQDADYANSPPTIGFDLGLVAATTAADLESKTGLVYQQRLILNRLDTLYASRTGFPYNFYRDFPLADDSSLNFKAGSNYALLLRMIDNDGLIVFTTQGVFTSTGALSTNNLALDKKGNWVIDESVPPIAIPGAVLFIDISTNTVRQLTYSEEFRSYTGEELSIFSNHLFAGNKVRSWAFQEGEFPLLWVTFTNGTYASFTYERIHNMRAWTRHDSGHDIEYVATNNLRGTDVIDSTITNLPGMLLFVTNKAGKRYIELGVPRYPSAITVAADLEYDMNESAAAMDAMVSWKDLLNDDLVDDVMTIAPVIADTWDGDLTLAVTDDAIFPDPGSGAVGTIFRHFHPVDKSVVDLEITDRASDNSVTVSPSAEFPSAYATTPNLYEVATVFTGLAHLDGEEVSVLADGAVVASPNNDIEDYGSHVPSSGSLTLAEPAAIVHIGRPYTMDIETLDVDTVEQRPTLIESKILNKLYVKVHQSRGLYIGSDFPADDKVDGMEPIEGIDIDYEDAIPIIGNRAPQPESKRHEVSIAGKWESEGRVCIRQVDPVHFEILSIIPDLEDQRR